MKISKSILIVISLIVIFVSLLVSLPKGNELTKWENDQKAVEQFQKSGSPVNEYNLNNN